MIEAEKANFNRTEIIFRMIRDKVLHEDHWIQQRIGWLLTINGFLFAGFGALVSIGTNPDSAEPTKEVVSETLMTIPAVGFGLAILTLAAVMTATVARRGALGEWEKLVSAEERRIYPSPRATGRALWVGGAASGGVCVLLAFTWLWAWIAILESV